MWKLLSLSDRASLVRIRSLKRSLFWNALISYFTAYLIHYFYNLKLGMNPRNGFLHLKMHIIYIYIYKIKKWGGGDHLVKFYLNFHSCKIYLRASHPNAFLLGRGGYNSDSNTISKDCKHIPTQNWITDLYKELQYWRWRDNLSFWVWGKKSCGSLK